MQSTQSTRNSILLHISTDGHCSHDHDIVVECFKDTKQGLTNTTNSRVPYKTRPQPSKNRLTIDPPRPPYPLTRLHHFHGRLDQRLIPLQQTPQQKRSRRPQTDTSSLILRPMCRNQAKARTEQEPDTCDIKSVSKQASKRRHCIRRTRYACLRQSSTILLNSRQRCFRD